MTPDRLKYLRELADKATPGPWRVWWNAEHKIFISTEESCEQVVLFCVDKPYPDWDSIKELGPNARFVAQSRTALPELISAYEKLRGENEILKKKVEIKHTLDQICTCDNYEKYLAVVDAAKSFLEYFDKYKFAVSFEGKEARDNLIKALDSGDK